MLCPVTNLSLEVADGKKYKYKQRKALYIILYIITDIIYYIKNDVIYFQILNLLVSFLVDDLCLLVQVLRTLANILNVFVCFPDAALYFLSLVALTASKRKQTKRTTATIIMMTSLKIGSLLPMLDSLSYCSECTLK